jgi:hypothetical protein
MKNQTIQFLKNRSLLGVVAAVAFIGYAALLSLKVIPNNGEELVWLAPALVVFFLGMGYAGCDFKGSLTPTCQFWDAPALVGSVAIQAILVYCVFALLERLLFGRKDRAKAPNHSKI